MPNHKSFLLSLTMALVLSSVGVRAGDPLDDLDGTEGWDQVVQPRQKQKRQADLERSSFKQEVEGWETIRQAWQEERETYIAEKSSQQRMLRQLRIDRRPPPEADITENTNNSGEWGDQPGESLFQPTGSIDRAIDDELGESGAVPAGSAVPAVPAEPPSTTGTVRGSNAAPDPYALRRERDRKEDRKLKAEQEAASKFEKEKEQKRQAELTRKKKEEDERLRKEQEAQAGEAAAAALLKQQEEQMRKEQEALRKKAKLNVDTEGQVVDPELQREMQDEPDSEEDSGN